MDYLDDLSVLTVILIIWGWDRKTKEEWVVLQQSDKQQEEEMKGSFSDPWRKCALGSICDLLFLKAQNM